jgi:hypothetical protein
MKVFKTPVSVFWGYPKSKISNRKERIKIYSDKFFYDLLTIQELINEDKVVLDVLLRNFAKIGLHHICHLQEELENH